MSEITKLNMVTEYWKHSDAGLRDERNRMAQGFVNKKGAFRRKLFASVNPDSRLLNEILK